MVTFTKIHNIKRIPYTCFHTLPRTQEIPSFDNSLVVNFTILYQAYKLADVRTICLERFPSIYVDTTYRYLYKTLQ